MSPTPIYIDIETVAAMVAMGVSTVHKLVAAEEFPKPRQITKQRVAWLYREVLEWAEARPVSSRLPPPNAGQGRKKVKQPTEQAAQAQGQAS